MFEDIFIPEYCFLFKVILTNSERAEEEEEEKNIYRRHDLCQFDLVYRWR